MLEPHHFFISDPHHIHARNFAPLFRFIAAHDIKTVVHEKHAALKRAMGNYVHEPSLEARAARLSKLSASELYAREHSYGNTPLALYPLYRAELLAYALATNGALHHAPIDRSEPQLFEWLYAHARALLVWNAAACEFWIDELNDSFVRERSAFSHAFVFSGSMIYTRVLMAMAKRSATKCIVLETSFTGHHFYLEERYAPLCAGADIQHQTVRAALRGRLTEGSLADLRGSVSRAMLAADNKNVSQPTHAAPTPFRDAQRPTLLLVGQVSNDFSIIEQPDCPLSSIAFYRELVHASLAHTDFNVIFKAHPWEAKKQHIQRPFTYEAMAQLRQRLPEAQQHRLLLVNDDNLVELGRRVDRTAMLNSQAGIELAFHCGLRPSTFGKPYYAGAGFSDDFQSVPQFVEHVRGQGHRAMLGLDDYDALLTFLVLFLELHCISTNARGQRQIEQRLPTEPGPASPRSAWSGLSAERMLTKGRKLLRDPKRFVRDSRVLRKLVR